MKKLLYILPMAFTFVACSGDTDDSLQKENDATTEYKNEPQEPNEPEEVESTAEEKFVESILGEWTCPASIAGIQIDINIKEDGSISQNIGPNSSSNTFRAIGGDKLEITNPKGEAFQTWEFKNITENSMDVCWNPDSPKPKTIPYKRK